MSTKRPVRSKGATQEEQLVSGAGKGLGIVLVLGGIRSGKSLFAEGLIAGADTPVYVATAESVDGNLDERIRIHRERRGANWRTIEAPLALGDAIREGDRSGSPVLVDSLGMWINNVLYHEVDLDAAKADLIESLAAAGTVVVVSDELGLGGVADNALARSFADRLGELNQQIAALADAVYLVVAGIPTKIKG